MTQTYAIAFVSSNPTVTSNVNAGRELNIIESTLAGTTYRLFSKTGADREDLIDLMAEIDNAGLPLHTFHLVAHGTRLGKAQFENSKIKYEDIQAIIQHLSPYIPCMFISACHSISGAKAFSQLAKHTILMRDALLVETGLRFTEKFYEYMVSRGHEIPNAFKWARNTLDISKIPGGDVPQLMINGQLTMATEAPEEVLLPTAAPSPISPKQPLSIQALLEQNLLMEVLTQIESQADQRVQGEIIGFKARLNQLETDKRQGVLSPEIIQLETNRIRQAIISLSKSLHLL